MELNKEANGKSTKRPDVAKQLRYILGNGRRAREFIADATELAEQFPSRHDAGRAREDEYAEAVVALGKFQSLLCKLEQAIEEAPDLALAGFESTWMHTETLETAALATNDLPEIITTLRKLMDEALRTAHRRGRGPRPAPQRGLVRMLFGRWEQRFGEVPTINDWNDQASEFLESCEVVCEACGYATTTVKRYALEALKRYKKNEASRKRFDFSSASR